MLIEKKRKNVFREARFTCLAPLGTLLGCVLFFSMEHEVASMTGASPATTIPRGASRGIVVAGLAPVMPKNETHPLCSPSWIFLQNHATLRLDHSRSFRPSVHPSLPSSCEREETRTPKGA